MRISITGESDFVGVLDEDQDAFPLEVQSVERSSDKSEQQFGLVEVATVITIVTGLVELTNAVMTLWEKRRAARDQRLRVKSPLGTVTLDLADGVDEETVRSRLAPLFAT